MSIVVAVALVSLLFDFILQKLANRDSGLLQTVLQRIRCHFPGVITSSSSWGWRIAARNPSLLRISRQLDIQYLHRLTRHHSLNSQ